MISMTKWHIGSLALVTALAGCGRDAETARVKMAGVGVNPDDIGPTAEYYGGLVEYDWVDFAGAQLPLGLLGLSALDPAGPSISGFQGPYAMIYGLAFVMEEDLPAPDALLGSFAAPPDAVGSCQTVYEPFSYLNNLADVGSAVSFHSEDDSVRFDVGRYPELYPPDPRDVFTYYIGLEAWRSTALKARTMPSEGDDPLQMGERVVRPVNWAFGETVDFDFPGGMPPMEASVGSIPVPLAAAGTDRSVTLPTRPEGVMLSWTGPVFDERGNEESSGAASSCLQYWGGETEPADATDCVEIPAYPTETINLPGQMYTGPWDTEDGVLFTWVPSESEVDEIVSITVRFLGPVDPEDEGLQEGFIPVAPDEGVQATWDAYKTAGFLPSDAQLGEGRRSPLACETEDDGLVWEFDDAYLQDDGSYVAYLQGDPLANLVETTCTLDDSAGQFLLTNELLEDAMAYGKLNGAEGAIFYFSRSTRAAIDAPPVRDRYGNRRDTSPLIVVSRAVQLGRFWFDL